MPRSRWIALSLLLVSLAMCAAVRAQTPSNLSNGGVEVTCTTTSGVLLAAQTTPANRVAFRLTHKSGSATQVCQAATCTATTGEPFVVGQVLYDGPALYGGVYSCITAAGSSVLAVIEVKRQ